MKDGEREMRKILNKILKKVPTIFMVLLALLYCYFFIEAIERSKTLREVAITILSFSLMMIIVKGLGRCLIIMLNWIRKSKIQEMITAVNQRFDFERIHLKANSHYKVMVQYAPVKIHQLKQVVTDFKDIPLEITIVEIVTGNQEERLITFLGESKKENVISYILMEVNDDFR